MWDPQSKVSDFFSDEITERFSVSERTIFADAFIRACLYVWTEFGAVHSFSTIIYTTVQNSVVVTRDGQSRTFDCSGTALELNISNPEFRFCIDGTRDIPQYSINKTKYKTNLFRALFITVQWILAIWMSPFNAILALMQLMMMMILILALTTQVVFCIMPKAIKVNRFIDAVHYADEKHLPADANIAGIAKYLITDFLPS